MKKVIAPLLILGIFLATLGTVEFVQTRTAHAAWFDNNYTYCQKWTPVAGGNSGGVATTTTANPSTGFTLVATSTMSTMAATSSAGHIAQLTDYTVAAASSTPLDVAFTNGTDCNAGGGTLIPFYFEDYNKTTGAFAVRLKTAVSSTSPQTVLMYYGSSAATNQSSEATTYGGLNEIATYSFGAANDLVQNVVDASGNNHTGQLTNFAAGTTTQQNSYVGQGLKFDGVNDEVVVPSFASASGAITFSGWVNRPWTTNAYTAVLGQGYSPTGGMGLLTTTGGTANDWLVHDILCVGNGYNSGIAPRAIAAPGTLTTNTWHHIVCVLGPNKAQIYLDGVALSMRVSKVGSVPSVTNSLRIGNDASNDWMNGVLDVVREYNRELDPMDIKTIYNNESNSATFWTYGTEETKTNTTPYIPHSQLIIKNAQLILNKEEWVQQ